MEDQAHTVASMELRTKTAVKMEVLVNTVSILRFISSFLLVIQFWNEITIKNLDIL